MEQELAEALRNFLRLVETKPNPRHGEYRMRFSVRAADYFAAEEALARYDAARK